MKKVRVRGWLQTSGHMQYTEFRGKSRSGDGSVGVQWQICGGLEEALQETIILLSYNKTFFLSEF